MRFFVSYATYGGGMIAGPAPMSACWHSPNHIRQRHRSHLSSVKLSHVAHWRTLCPCLRRSAAQIHSTIFRIEIYCSSDISGLTFAMMYMYLYQF